MVSHYLAMFGSFWYITSEDLKYLICHVTI